MIDLVEIDISTLQIWMESGICSSLDLVDGYIMRIEKYDSKDTSLSYAVNSVIEINSAARSIAIERDIERKKGVIRGPLHGIPVLVKDNIETGDGMVTSAGSLVMRDNYPRSDAILVQKLRSAGAVILGKTNLSEWANFRSPWSSSGWSSRGGLTRNPYILNRSASGSSSGSAAAVAASFCSIAVGTETDGSILSPAAACGIVGLKPGLGAINAAGIIPLAHSQDTAGPMARTVKDCALLYQVLSQKFVNNESLASLSDFSIIKGTRIGVLRNSFDLHRELTPIFEAAILALRVHGVDVVDNIPMPDMTVIWQAELEVLLHEFKIGINRYLASLVSVGVPRSLGALIDMNAQYSASVMPWFGQEYLELAIERGGLDDQRYIDSKQLCRRLAWTEGLASILQSYQLSACIAPSNNPSSLIDLLTGDHHTGGSSSLAAVAGTPSLTVPIGLVEGLPVGATFLAGPGKEEVLLRYGQIIETVISARAVPCFKTDMGEKYV